MADVNANINVSLNTAQAEAQLRQLQNQISAFNRSFASINSQGAQQAQAMNRALMDGINATKMFNARIIPVTSTVDRFSNALEKGKLTIGEYSKFAASQLPGMRRVFASEFGMMEKLVTERVKKMQTQYIELGKSARGVQEALAITPTTLSRGYGTEMAMAIQRQQMFNKLIDDGSTKLLNWGKNTQWAGRQLMVGFSLPLAALGSVAAQTFMELDKASIAFERVYGDLSTTTQEIERNKEALFELGKEYTRYGISLADTINLGARVAATGLEGEDMLAATQETLRFATLGQMDYNTALDATISLQSAFKIETEDLANKIDFLNAVENQTVLTIQDIAAAIPRVAPVIKGLGGDVEDLVVMMTAMREGGVTAEQGANALKSGLASLINPTNRAQESLSKLGINMTEIINQNQGDLLGTVKAFGEALSVVGEFEQQQALEQIFGKYQYARMGALFENIADSSSQAQRAMDLMGMSMEELAQLSERELSKIEESTTVKFQAALEALKVSIAPLGEAFLKGIMPIMEFLSNIANAFNELPGPVKNAIAVITGVVGGLGPVFLMTIGLIGNGVANLVKGIQFFRRTLARIRGDAKNFEFLSIAQLEAQGATEALDGSVQDLTGSLLIQKRAVAALIREYERYASVAGIAGAAASRGGRGGRGGSAVEPKLKMAKGGVVPGSGSGDKIPALLEPGEMVVTKEAAQRFGPVIAAMNAGTLPGFEGGLDNGIAGIPLPTGARLSGRTSAQSIEELIESAREAAMSIDDLAERNRKLDDINRVVTETFSEQTKSGKLVAVSASKLAQQLDMIDLPKLRQVGQGIQAAHLTKTKTGLSEEGISFLSGKRGEAPGGGSLPAQRILDALEQSPELSEFIKEYSGLSAELPGRLNRELAHGTATFADFNEAWSKEGSRLNASLVKFGDYVDDGTGTLQKFEADLLERIQDSKEVKETGLVSDKLLERETRALIEEYKNGGAAQKRLAVAADKAATTVAQVSLDMSTKEGQEAFRRLEKEGRAFTDESGNQYLGTRENRGAFVARVDDSGRRPGERVGELAKQAGKTQGRTQTEALKAATGTRSPSTEGEYVSEMVAQGQLKGAQENIGTSARAGQIAGEAQVGAMKSTVADDLARADQRLVALRRANGASEKQIYQLEQSQARRRIRDREAMLAAGMTSSQITRQETRLTLTKIRTEEARLREAKRAQILAAQAATLAAQTNAAEAAANVSRSAALKSKVGGAARGVLGKTGVVGTALGMGAMIPMMQGNMGLGMGMMGAGMGLEMLGMGLRGGAAGKLATLAPTLAALAPPVLAATAAIGALAIGAKIYRERQDAAARAAAEMGANAGVTANAINTMAQVMGTLTPAQRRAQQNIQLTEAEQEQASQFATFFESDEGKQFVEDLKDATSEERFQKLADYLRSAIAAGIMDEQVATAFAKSMSLQLGDTLLNMRLERVIGRQGTGAAELMSIAQERRTAAGNLEAFQDLEQPGAISNQNAAAIVGSSLQNIQDFANVAALAQEEFKNGTLSYEQYNNIVTEARQEMDNYTRALLDATGKTVDVGATMQAINEQLLAMGMTEEQRASMEEAASQDISFLGRMFEGYAGAERIRGNEQRMAAGAAAFAGGMQQPMIDATLNYLANNLDSLANRVFTDAMESGRESTAVAEAAAARTAEAGNVAGIETPEDVEMYVKVMTEFVEQGGSVDEYAIFVESIPEEKRVEILTEFEGLTPEQQTNFVKDMGELQRIVGAEMASAVMDSEGFKPGESGKVISDLERLSKVFGGDQQKIQRYVELFLEESPEGFTQTLPTIVEDLEILGQIPPEIRSVLGIDLENPEDVEKYGPMAEALLQLSPALEALPEDQRAFAANLTMTSNGEVKDPIAFAKDVVAYQKTLNKLSDDKVEVRKEAAIDLIVQAYDAQGNPVDPEQAQDAMNYMVQELGITEAEFLQLPPDKISKIIEFMVEAKGLEEAAATYNALAAASFAAGDSEAGRQYQAAANRMSAAAATARAEATAATGAGLVEGGNELTGGGGGGGGGEKKDPFKDLKQAVLAQLQSFSDLETKMKDLFGKKSNFLAMAMKNKGIDDKIRQLNLTPALAEQISSMNPADARKVINRISRGGQLNRQGRQLNRAVLAGSIAERMDTAAQGIAGSQAQMSALADLQRRGAPAAALESIAGDPDAAKEYLALVQEANRAQRALAEAGDGAGKKLRRAYQEAKGAVQEYIDKIVEAQQKQAGTEAVIAMATETATNEAAAQALSNLSQLKNVDQDVQDWAQENPQQFAQLIAGYDGNIKQAIKAIQQNLAAIEALKTPEQVQMEALDAAYEETQQQNEDLKAQFELIFVEIEQRYEKLIDASKQRIQGLQDSIKVIQGEIDALERLNDGDRRRIRALERQKEMINRQVQVVERQNELDQRRVDALNRQSEMINRQIELLDRANELDQRRVDALTRQIEMMTRQQDAINRQIEDQERLNELDQRRIDDLSRADEMRQRQAEALNRELELMSRSEQEIRDAYDQRIRQLDEIEQAQKRVSDQAKTQLDLAKALSTGDIFAATAAAQQMRENQIQNARQDTRTAMQQGMENQVAGLRTAGGLTRQEAEGQIQGINDQSYQTQLAIRDIQDQIYERTQALIPLRDQIYAIDQNIQLVNDQILVIQDQIYERELERIPFLEQIRDIGLAVRDIEDVIYQRNLELLPLKDAIYNKDLEIRDVQDAIYNRESQILDIQVGRLQPLQDALNKENDVLDSLQKQLETEKDNTRVNGITYKQLNQQIQSQAAIYGYQKAMIRQGNRQNQSVANLANLWATVMDNIKAANDHAKNLYSTAEAMRNVRAGQFEVTNDPVETAENARRAAANADAWLAQEYARIDAERNASINAALATGRSAMGQYAGGFVSGDGGRDSVLRILSPGEFVVRRSMVKKYGMPMLEALNTGSLPRYSIPTGAGGISASTPTDTQISAPVYNTYSVNVNVPNASVNADDVANKVLYKIRQIDASAVRGYRGF